VLFTGHPHVRGDYGRVETTKGVFLGPSPRAWGLPESTADAVLQSRAIPTCVGTTNRTYGCAMDIPGHPHVRGDYRMRSWWVFTMSGPSPRAWGLHPPAPVPAQDLRAIPTCVGTTDRNGLAGGGKAGHPHVRGDY